MIITIQLLYCFILISDGYLQVLFASECNVIEKACLFGQLLIKQEVVNWAEY